jgi:two-component system, NarL family, nitrate/nitrite response regulator NarL
MSTSFSPREKQIASLISKGFSNREIAEQLEISVGTIKLHVHHILLKAGAQSRGQIERSKHPSQAE